MPNLSSVMAAQAATQASQRLACGGGVRARVGSVFLATLNKIAACLGGRLRGHDEIGEVCRVSWGRPVATPRHLRAAWALAIALCTATGAAPAVAQGQQNCNQCSAIFEIKDCDKSVVENPPAGEIGVAGNMTNIQLEICGLAGHVDFNVSQSTGGQVSGPIRVAFGPCELPKFKSALPIFLVMRSIDGQFRLKRNCSRRP
jgi:hypothetical protein